MGETPVPIPNTTVKTQAADDTWRVTARESKWMPDSYKNKICVLHIFQTVCVHFLQDMLCILYIRAYSSAG